MALPTSPSVVVIENDVSVYTPNVNSSVVGIVGFADKGPVDKATLVTSQQNLLTLFGKPATAMPGQGLEGALEILEATNQLYFVHIYVQLLRLYFLTIARKYLQGESITK